MGFLARIFRRPVVRPPAVCCGTTETTANIGLDGAADTLIALTCKGCSRIRWSTAMPSRVCPVCANEGGVSTAINNRGVYRSVVFRWRCGHFQSHPIELENAR